MNDGIRVLATCHDSADVDRLSQQRPQFDSRPSPAGFVIGIGSGSDFFPNTSQSLNQYISTIAVKPYSIYIFFDAMLCQQLRASLNNTLRSYLSNKSGVSVFRRPFGRALARSVQSQLNPAHFLIGCSIKTHFVINPQSRSKSFSLKFTFRFSDYTLMCKLVHFWLVSILA
jgi:hypothetical protein